MAQNPETQTMVQNLTIKMEARKAKLEAEMAEVKKAVEA